jgi:geranylgeranyl diphosphate synthase type II
MSTPNATDIDSEHFHARLRDKAQLVNDTLRRLLAHRSDIQRDLKKALDYTLHAKGKRTRAALLLWSCQVVSGQINRDAEIAAAAIEMVHTYSLVHDDLPAMDNDDFRRGLPTCHKAFDEATAILTGDALLTLAFEVLASQIDDPVIAVSLIRELARDAGPGGMIAGQLADLKAENAVANKELLEYIHTNKTARMFRCAAAMGAVCGRAEQSQLDRLCKYGLKIGLGFQIADDILDVCGSSDHLGKTAGKDAKAAKCTYPAVMGLEKSRQVERKLADEAVALLQPFGQKADILRQLAMVLLERTR